jgi:hypothetical protein
MKAKLLAQKNVPVEEKKIAKVVIPKKKSNVKRMSLSKPKPKTKKIEKPVQPVKIEIDANELQIIPTGLSSSNWLVIIETPVGQWLIMFRNSELLSS